MKVDSARFASEAGALRDNVIAAFERNEMSRVQEGFSVYETLIHEIVSSRLRLEERLQFDGSSSIWHSFRSRYGPEWDTLVRDLYGVVDAAGRSEGTRAWTETMSWLFRLSGDFLRQGWVTGLQTLLDLVTEAWRQDLAASRTTSQRQVDLLIRLRELLWPRDLQTVATRDLSTAIEWTVCRTFVHLIKGASDGGHEEAARLACLYFSEAPFGEATGSFAVARSASMLVLHGWQLLQIERSGLDPQRSLLDQLEIELAEGPPIWEVVALAHDSDFEHVLGSEWWEFAGPEPSHGGVLQMSSYVDLAAVVASRRSPIVPEPSLGEPGVEISRRLTETIKSYRSGAYPHVRELDGRSDEELDRLEGAFSQVVRAADAARDRQIGLMPIDGARVASLYQAVEDGLTARRAKSLAAILADSTTSAELNLFGIDALFPKWYFADTYVFAEPDRLGRDLVGALLRGEDDRVVEAIFEEDEAGSFDDMDALHQAIERWTRSRNALAGSALVLTNSWQAMSKLVPSSDSVSASGDRLLTTSFGATAYRLFDDRPPWVAAVIHPEGLSVRRGAGGEEIAGDRVLERAGVMLGVKALSPEEIAGLIDRGGTEEQLRLSVRVRLLERLQVIKSSADLLARWSLPPESW